MCRSELVKRSGISKQQLSRLENGQIRMRLDHLKPFAAVLGYTPEQILLWGRYPGTPAAISNQATCCARKPATTSRSAPSLGQVPELDTRAGLGGGGVPAREVRKDGSHADPLKAEGWLFPQSFRARAIAHLRRAAFWCSTPPATAWRRPSSPASASSSIPVTRRRRRTGFMPSATLSSASSSSACRCCVRRGRRGSKIISDNPNHAERGNPAQRARNRRQGAVLPEAVLSRRARPAPPDRTESPRRRRLLPRPSCRYLCYET